MVMDEATRAGNNFTLALKRWGGKQVDLAKALGVKPQRIQHWKKRGVSAKLAAKVAKLINANAGEISGLDDESIGEPLAAYNVVSDLSPDDMQKLLEIRRRGDKMRPEDINVLAQTLSGVLSHDDMIHMARVLLEAADKLKQRDT